MKKKNILILGASSDIGLKLLEKINFKKYNIGAHCNKNFKSLIEFKKKNIYLNKDNFQIIKKNLSNQKNCHDLVRKFIKIFKKIDILVQLTGSLCRSVNWKKIKAKHLTNDININLNSTIFVCQKVFLNMKKNKKGKFILTSTGSTNYGGSANSLGYGISKAGLELFSKLLAKSGGKYNITSNTISPGFIKTKFHKIKTKNFNKFVKDRSNFNILKRPGSTDDVSNLIYFLISEKSNFITGENIPITGGDWL